MRPRAFYVFLGLLVWSSGLFAQQYPPPPDWNKKIEQLSFARRPLSAYRLGNGDLVEIKVFGEEQFSQTARLGPQGEVTMPFIGNVQLGGLTQLEAEIRLKELLGGRFLQNPQITVSVQEYNSQPLFILGAVRSPGNYKMVQRLNLIDALIMAGGLDISRAGDHAIIQRALSIQADPSVEPETIDIDLKDLLEKGNLSLNIPLEAGDIIQIPERSRRLFYLIGEVNSPGAKELAPNQKLFLTQALAQAGGPMKTAKMKKATLIRYDEKAGRQEIAVNLDAIIKGKKPDMFVVPDDIIFIPGSTFKNIGYGMLGLIPGVATHGVTSVVR